MYYQPIVDARDPSMIQRYEALARWTLPGLGVVSPIKFIRVAETRGLMIQLGWLLLDLVCRDFVRYGIGAVNVNVSPTQLMVPGFAEEFSTRVAAYGIAPMNIEVELTEDIAVLDDEVITRELSSLRDKGFMLALDDFGTGYASVSYLTQAPFDVLKIDRSFMPSSSKGKEGRRMLLSMIRLAQAMNLKIVAEGIETEADATLLRDMGANHLQGYYLGRPVPAAALVSKLVREAV